MRVVILLTTLLALAGCSLVAAAPSLVPPLAGLEGVSIMGTKKSLADHYVSLTTGKHCSILRRDEGRTYCEEDEKATPEEVYCYRTLGNVTCYDKPQKDNPDRVGHIAPGSPPPR